MIIKKICHICRKVKHDNCDRCKKREFTSSPNPFYQTPKWRKKAKRHKLRNPLCVECLSNGITKATEVTDHIIPLKQGGDPFNDDNLQSLCHRCHNSKSGKESKLYAK